MLYKRVREVYGTLSDADEKHDGRRKRRVNPKTRNLKVGIWD